MWVPGRNWPCLYGLRSTVYVEQVGADAAVVEQRVALAGRAVAGDPLALAPPGDQELEQAPLGLLDLRGEREVRLERVEAERALARDEVVHALLDRPGAGRPALRVEPQRAAVRLELARRRRARGRGAAKHALRGQEREVLEVLVVDRVELVVLDQPQQVRHLDRHDALGREHHLEAGDEVVEVRHVRHHVVGGEQVRAPPLGHELRARAPGRRTARSSRSRARARPRPRWRRARCRAPGCRARRRAAAGSRRCSRPP